jgi:hypothetical protein
MGGQQLAQLIKYVFENIVAVFLVELFSHAVAVVVISLGYHNDVHGVAVWRKRVNNAYADTAIFDFEKICEVVATFVSEGLAVPVRVWKWVYADFGNTFENLFF